MLNRRSLMIILPAAAAGLAYGFWPRSESTPVEIAGEASAAVGDFGIPDMTLGDPNAPVKVIEYASFSCSHCASFHRDTFKDFKAEYIDTGKVYFTHREVFFDRYALWAALMARCSGPDRYYGLIDQVYATQRDWVRQEDPAQVAASLKKIGLQAGIDGEALDACMQDGDMAEKLMDWYEAHANRDGVKATPTFLINGALHEGNMSLSELGALVDAASS